MLVYSTFLVTPTMLSGSNEKSGFRFANVGFGASWAGESVNQGRVAEKRDSIFVRCVEQQFRCLKLDFEDDFYLLFEKLGLSENTGSNTLQTGPLLTCWNMFRNMQRELLTDLMLSKTRKEFELPTHVLSGNRMRWILTWLGKPNV